MQGFELIKLKGISLRIHPSWVLILILFTVASQGQLSREFDAQFPAWQTWGVAVFTSFLLFLSVAVYEISHSFMALYEGIKINSIYLFFLGGLERFGQQCSSPLSNLRVAIAGPLASLSTAFLFFILANIYSNINPLILNALSQIIGVNLILALFNLLPSLPLDGGEIIKSLVWYFTGSQRKGHKVANISGHYLSLLGLFLGGLIAFSGGGINGLWLIIIGWLGLTSSKSQDQIMLLQEALSEVLVRDASRKRFRVLEENNTLKVLSELKLTSLKENGFSEWVLLCSSGRWTGYITDKPLKEIPSDNWESYPLASYKKPLSELPSIRDDIPLWGAVLKLEELKEMKLLVFNSAGLPSGIIDKADLGAITLKKLGVNIPKSFLELARKNNTYPLGLSLLKIVHGMIASGLIQKSELEKLTM